MNITKNKNIIYIVVYFISIIIQKINIFSHTTFSLWINIFRYCFLEIISIFLFKELYKDSIDNWKNKPLKCLILIPIVFIIDIIVMGISQIPLGIINPDYVSSNESNILEALKILPPIVSLILLGILGPITEEIVFRGILVGKLKEKIPTSICVIVSSILFMLIHIHTLKLEEFLFYLSIFFTGIIYSVTFAKSKNITIPIVLHILNNFPSLLLMIISL